MYFYQEAGRCFCALSADLPLPAAPPPLEMAKAEPVFLFRRAMSSCRAGFAVSDPRLLWEQHEGVHWLDSRRIAAAGEDLPWIKQMTAARRLRAVNISHPRWRDLAACRPARGKKRLNLLALGDVGATLLIGLRLLGGEQIDSIGIFDVNEKQLQRWEFEINQIAAPMHGHSAPRVEIITREQLFACDIFVFCAAKGLPPVGARVEDVRGAQYADNAALIGEYARQARKDGFGGLFAVVSDPVDLLCKAALLASNRGSDGGFDGLGLLPEQIQGYGLGVMDARAAYYARQEPRFAAYLREGRAFGPHGADLVIANSIEHYDDELSRELTRLTVNANMEMRKLGFKPFVAPALSSGALALLLTMAGEWHYSCTFLGGVFMGARNRFTAAGLETEMLELPPALFCRIRQAAENLAAV